MRGEGTAPRIGITPRFFHRAPAEAGLGERRLLYLEESVAHWLMSRGALPLMIPSISPGGARVFAEGLDGLVLQGGVDISPALYGAAPLREEWCGDPVRDAQELELLQAFLRLGKPVLGICRGLQLINVARGGTLFQDIPSQLPHAVRHRDFSLFDRLRHRVTLQGGSRLASLYPATVGGAVNSIHHQGVDRLGEGLVVEARAGDGVVEALRGEGEGFLFAVQWHPEFHPQGEEGLLSGEPILADFLGAVRATGAPPLR
ncbi:MAG TPA: type 1 glutamine amidotransferase [Verrucomicrobiae bacterium]|nr:type 1 glutamine amidotransferase [Verrucomicrobiae bacterium]